MGVVVLCRAVLFGVMYVRGGGREGRAWMGRGSRRKRGYFGRRARMGVGARVRARGIGVRVGMLRGLVGAFSCVWCDFSAVSGIEVGGSGR